MNPNNATRPLKSQDADSKNVLRRAAIRDVLDACSKKAAQLRPDAPDNVRWAALAFDLDVSIHTVQHWARKGYIPKSSAVSLARRYGAKLVRVEDVSTHAI